MESMEIMNRIAERMRELGLRAADVARRTGLHPSRISRWLDGQGEPNLVQFRALVMALESSADDMLGLSPPIKLDEDQQFILKAVSDMGYAEARRRLLGIGRPAIEALPTVPRETQKPVSPPASQPDDDRNGRRSGTG